MTRIISYIGIKSKNNVLVLYFVIKRSVKGIGHHGHCLIFNVNVSVVVTK